MIPIYQTRLGERGNCLAACIASLIEVTIDEVDFSCADHPQTWDDVAREKLHTFGLSFIHAKVKREGGKGYPALWTGGALCIAHGPSLRGLDHAVVYDCRMKRHAHDPHPDNTGIIRMDAVSVIVPLDPALFMSSYLKEYKPQMSNARIMMGG